MGDLYEIFATYGAIQYGGVSARMKKDDGLCTGIGFVNYLDKESAESAIDNLNGTILPSGRLLKVSQCDPQRNTKGKDGKGGGKGKDAKGAPRPSDNLGKARPKAKASAPTPDALPLEDEAL